jgi:putative sterol carrier protein
MEGSMADATGDFFDALSARGMEPLVGRTRATVRFDIAEGDLTDHWLVRIHDGAIEVTHADGEADSVIRSEKAAFDEVAAGRTNAMSATLRGALVMEGDPRLLVRVQRLFPAPVGMPANKGARSIGKRRS